MSPLFYVDQLVEVVLVLPVVTLGNRGYEGQALYLQSLSDQY